LLTHITMTKNLTLITIVLLAGCQVEPEIKRELNKRVVQSIQRELSRHWVSEDEQPIGFKPKAWVSETKVYAKLGREAELRTMNGGTLWEQPFGKTIDMVDFTDQDIIISENSAVAFGPVHFDFRSGETRTSYHVMHVVRASADEFRIAQYAWTATDD